MRLERVERILHVLLEVPGRLVLGASVPAKVESDDVEARGEPFGELREMAAVARDPVQAGDDRRAALAPLVAVQDHEPAGASGADASSVRRVSASLTSDQTTTPCLSIRKVPRIAAPVDSSKTP